MTDRPILFSAPMVRAILAGTKTQTRRIIKDQDIGEKYCEPCDDGRVLLEWLGTPCCGSGVWNVPEYSAKVASPYGLIGDRLWVRETWSPNFGNEGGYLYRADYNGASGFHRACLKTGVWTHYTEQWRPSIHMPRAASRITLDIGGVRVERLQDISEADALAEGIVQLKDGGYGLPAGEHYHSADPRQSYFSLWEAINGPGSVEANAWVWVVEFKRFPAPGAAPGDAQP